MDCTTISKEIRNHLVFKKSGAFGKPFNDCTLEKRDCPAMDAQKVYELTRSESRSSFAISETKLEHLDSVVSPSCKRSSLPLISLTGFTWN